MPTTVATWRSVSTSLRAHGASPLGRALTLLLVGLAVGAAAPLWAQPPIASFTAEPRVGCSTPHTVFFTNTTLGDLLSWHWELGDGSISSAENPIYSYMTSGVFEVELTATNAEGSGTRTSSIAVSLTEAAFSATSTFGCGPLVTDFTDESTSTSTVVGWSWDFGDGTTSTLADPSHSYEPGVYTVTLEVTDVHGCTDSVTMTNLVEAIGPAVDFTADVVAGPAPLTVSFTDASLSGSPIIGRSWDFGDGTASGELNPSHSYADPGVYDVGLTLMDLNGCSRTLVQPELVTVAASVDLAITVAGDSSAIPGEALTYTVVVSNGDTSDDPAAMVTDAFPAGLTCSWTSVASGGASGNSDGSGDLAEVLELPAASTVTYAVDCAIDPAITGTLENVAMIVSSATDPDLSDNTASVETLLTPQVDLAVTLTDGIAATVPGAMHDYTVMVSNAGPSAAPGIGIDLELPAALQGVTWTCVATPGSSCASAGSGDVLAPVSLAVGGSATFLVTGTVAGDFVGTLAAAVDVEPGPGAVDLGANDDAATDSTEVAAFREIPSLDGVGLALLALLVAVAAMIRTRRRGAVR